MKLVNQWKYRKLMTLTLWECTLSVRPDGLWAFYFSLVVCGIGIRHFGKVKP